MSIRPAATLTITPFFDSSVVGAADQTEVESAINDAIGTIESLYTNTGTVGIVFSRANGGFLGQSDTADYSASYANYTAARTTVSQAEPTNTVLSSAVATLSSGNQPGPGGSVLLTSADARVQSALSWSGVAASYNVDSPEYAMLESIGYNGVPEPASLAVFAIVLAGLQTARRRRQIRKVQ